MQRRLKQRAVWSIEFKYFNGKLFSMVMSAIAPSRVVPKSSFESDYNILSVWTSSFSKRLTFYCRYLDPLIIHPSSCPSPTTPSAARSKLLVVCTSFILLRSYNVFYSLSSSYERANHQIIMIIIYLITAIKPEETFEDSRKTWINNNISGWTHSTNHFHWTIRHIISFDRSHIRFDFE